MLDKGVHLPIAPAAADPVDEVREHPAALLGVQYLGVELHCVEAAGSVLGSGHRAVGCVGRDGKAGGWLGNVVVVAHPADSALADPGKQFGCGVDLHLGFAVLPLGRAGDPAA